MNRDNTDVIAVFLLIMIAIVFTLIGAVCGWLRGVADMENRAVKSGHAYYVADDFGKPQFKWKEQP